jgi:acetyl-CoA C-acetyltransferase
MREVVIVSAARTPFGKFGGMLKDFTAVDLGTMAVLASL